MEFLAIKLATTAIISYYINQLSLFNDRFDQSMKIGLINRWAIRFLKPDKFQQYITLKENYFNNINSSSKSKIPKIIHQIWVGNHPLPKQYSHYQRSWQKHHPKWKYLLWTDKELKNLDNETQDLISKARSFAEQADIIRLAILRDHGGLYVDMDSLCLKPIDELLAYQDFLTVTSATDFSFEIANSLIACSKNHPLILDSIHYLKTNWDQVEVKFDNSHKLKSYHSLARRRTMFPLDFAVNEYLKNSPQSKKVMVLPASYCNPFYKNLANLAHRVIFGYYKYDIAPETQSIHIYRKYHSFIKKENFYARLFKGNQVKGMVYKFSQGKSIQNRMFEQIYIKNHPQNIPFNLEPMIPQTIHLLNQRKELIIKIKEKFPQLKIQIWSKEDLQEFKLPSNSIAELFAVHILHKYGGLFLTYPTSLNDDFLECINKYSFVASINQLHSLKENLRLSASAFAGVKNHKILGEVIRETNRQQINLKELEEIYTKSFYRFWQIQGPVIAIN